MRVAMASMPRDCNESNCDGGAKDVCKGATAMAAETATTAGRCGALLGAEGTAGIESAARGANWPGGPVSVAIGASAAAPGSAATIEGDCWAAVVAFSCTNVGKREAAVTVDALANTAEKVLSSGCNLRPALLRGRMA
jgi:hypothetical protein